MLCLPRASIAAAETPAGDGSCVGECPSAWSGGRSDLIKPIFGDLLVVPPSADRDTKVPPSLGTLPIGRFPTKKRKGAVYLRRASEVSFAETHTGDGFYVGTDSSVLSASRPARD